MAFISLDEICHALKENHKYWIVFTGDSIASCEWVHPNWRDIVIYVLQEEVTKQLNGDYQTSEWGIKGFNFAYDGSTTKDVYSRISEVLFVKPQLVISLMGGNDSTFGVTVADSVNYISKIADSIINSKTKLVWSNSTPAGKGSKKNPEYTPYAKAFMDLPEKDGLFKIDMFHLYQSYPTEKIFTFISEENPEEGIKAGEIDLQHPNQLGNAYIAQVILDQVFGVAFNPEQYIQETNEGKKFPGYRS